MPWPYGKRPAEPGDLEHVCPQRFAAPLAPHLAARAEGREIDGDLLRRGLDYWRSCSEIVLVEGAGGLMSPLGDDEYVADLARDLGFPLIIVSRNILGTINATLQTLITASVHRFDHGALREPVQHRNERFQGFDTAAELIVFPAVRCTHPITSW